MVKKNHMARKIFVFHFFAEKNLYITFANDLETMQTDTYYI